MLKHDSELLLRGGGGGEGSCSDLIYFVEKQSTLKEE